MLRRTLRLWRRACGAGGAIFALHSGQPGRLGGRLARSRYASQYTSRYFAGLPVGRVEAQRGGCPLAEPCMRYQALWLSRFAFMQRGLGALAGKHLRDWCRSFCRSFYMQSHRRCSSAKEKDDERAAARREAKQSLKLLS